ncbi:sigma-54 dependent DNA-binding response regulator [Myxococcus xanthus DK 1622]|uniref:Sigma-54 dependent DNA-binding response regulator n=1 Tax=Myxococcus xanthus (strain DK1622) TaxID=246197 RepID=Q1DFW8_MYXXD|nr:MULTISPECIES: sigma-54 dependent transcriptional regulator [Myxococcus]ABF89084.1 sigma-54 dependent DNA-binding response regulator [Myxococcus xanthus DK 1622]NOJ54552.1 sigma-54-dependent Fis family transcriptional regulator [Myxococcus xanthus]QPM79903.1 sigma-54-dependent Fis family transcriptional regulator [Myxococcus xanthus]QVW68967.1 sigma-54-dependent Fis family transcriptional regulator [Myxococcus xanthus DZ2]QZZ47732.1 Alginate biosynthesis transcriptional regulatory protein Al
MDIGERPMRVLVVDDERNIRHTLRVCLEGFGCEVREAATPEAALAALAQGPADLAFVDLRLGTASGMELLPRLLAESPHLDVVLITAYATFDTAVEAMRRGARDYLPKPFTPAQIRHAVEKARRHQELASQLENLEGQLSQAVPEATLETASPAMHAAIGLLTRAAASDAAVLLRGESGTGKGVLARALHSMSARRRRPFVTVNCPTLSEQLLASELFGHVRGAFTGAVKDQPGRVEAAEGGTLFLDEIAEMSPGLQAQLLRFLQEKQFERLGEGRTRKADVRVVAATNRDLEKDVAEGRFREDLLYRLNVIEVKLPSLRERPEDLLSLARRFVSFFARAAQRPPPELSPATEKMLLAYGWPGNVRELRNAMERALIVWPAEVLEPQAFPDRIAAAGSPVMTLGGPHTLEDIEREHVLRVMASAPTLDEAARVLGIDASTLWRKRKKYESGEG